VVRAEAGKDTKGKVESSDNNSGGEMHGAGRNAEVGDEPQRIGCKSWGDAGDESVEFVLGEAVQEEVSYDEIVRTSGSDAEGGGVMDLEASGGVGGTGFASSAKELEHGGAAVYGVGLEMGIGGHQGGEEAAVSVAENQCVATVKQLREVVGAAAFEGCAEGKVFEPAIGAGYAVEVGPCLHR
jgi:hypothetical protein